jgi:hypothetical protein
MRRLEGTSGSAVLIGYSSPKPWALLGNGKWRILTQWPEHSKARLRDQAAGSDRLSIEGA